MTPLTVATVLLDNDPNGVCASQIPSGAVDMTINGALATGGVATMTMAQIMTIDSTGNDSGITFTVYGADADGKSYSEVVTGGNATTAVTVGYFKTITQIATSGAAAAGVIVGPIGTNGGVTKTLRVNRNEASFALGLYVKLTASPTINYTAEFSPDWPESGSFASVTTRYSNTADWRSVDGLASLTATDESNIAYPVECVRLKVNTNTVGTGTLKVQQSY
jgi:hypothetical protein